MNCASWGPTSLGQTSPSRPIVMAERKERLTSHRYFQGYTRIEITCLDPTSVNMSFSFKKCANVITWKLNVPNLQSSNTNKSPKRKKLHTKRVDNRNTCVLKQCFWCSWSVDDLNELVAHSRYELAHLRTQHNRYLTDGPRCVITHGNELRV